MKIESLLKKLKHIEKNTLSSMSKKVFNELYGFPAKPVILKNAFQDWSIKEKWNINFLRSKFQEKIEVEFSEGEGKVLQTIDSFLEENSRYKYLRMALNQDFIETESNHDNIKIFNCWYKDYTTDKNKKSLSWLYLGNAHSYTDIHRDIWRFNSWLYLISGTKLWFIYPKSYNEIIAMNKNNYGIANMDELLSQTYKPLIAVQEPGDMIYVPSNYYHFVYNVERSLAYTGNFFNETNYEDVKAYFSSNNNSKTIQKMINEGFKTHIKNKDYGVTH